MKEKTSNITNFIGVYDNFITPQECNRAIKFFEDMDKFNKTMNRITSEGMSVLRKQDQHYFCTFDQYDVWFKELKTMIINFDLAFNHYCEQTGATNIYDVKYKYTTLKLQKTLPTEGYHDWHVEYSSVDSEALKRAFVFSIYLNDVKDGGETEFLYFSKRVKPKKGRIVIWPAAFPYVHRGNPPISGEKYILTSWMLLPMLNDKF